MTRREMIDEAVRRVLRPGRLIPTSSDPGTRDYVIARTEPIPGAVCGVPVTLSLIDAITGEFHSIRSEAARSAVAQVGNG